MHPTTAEFEEEVELSSSRLLNFPRQVHALTSMNMPMQGTKTQNELTLQHVPSPGQCRFIQKEHTDANSALRFSSFFLNEHLDAMCSTNLLYTSGLTPNNAREFTEHPFHNQRAPQPHQLPQMGPVPACQQLEPPFPRWRSTALPLSQPQTLLPASTSLLNRTGIALQDVFCSDNSHSSRSHPCSLKKASA